MSTYVCVFVSLYIHVLLCSMLMDLDFGVWLFDLQVLNKIHSYYGTLVSCSVDDKVIVHGCFYHSYP